MIVLYALSNVARAGATRSSYHSAKVFIAIDGVQYGTGRDGVPGVLDQSLTINDELNETPNTAACTTCGFVPVEGQDVVITLGSRNNANREFGGTILSTRAFYVGAPSNYQHALSLIDYTWGLNRRKVRARYTATTVATVAAGLLTYTSGYTLTVAADIGAQALDEITFTEQDVAACFSQLVGRVGGAWRCDYHRVIRVFFTDDTGTAPTVLSAAHRTLMAVEVRRDLSQFITRVYVEGGGSNALTDVAPGETILPVTAGEWFEPAGGVVVSGPQRITYVSSTIGGTGGLVGPGAGPSGAPSLALANGVGVPSGAHTYAVTFQTATGQSLPSPVAAITVGAVPPPVYPLVLGTPTAGSGPDPGMHSYAVTFVTAVGETTPSPIVRQATAVTPAPGNGPVPNAPLPGVGVDLGTHDYALTFVTAIGETSPSPIGPAVTTHMLAGPTQAPTLVQRADGFGYSKPGLNAGDTIEVVYTYSSNDTDVTIQTAPSPASASLVLVGDPQYPGYLMALWGTVYLPTDPLVKWITVWLRNVTTGSAFLDLYGIQPPGYGGNAYQVNLFQGGWGPVVLPAASDVIGQVPVTLPRAIGDLGNGLIGPDPKVTSRKIYRRSGGAGLRLLTTIPNNSATSYTDTTPTASLGAAPPSFNSAYLQRIPLTSIPIGISLVTARKIYRTAANDTQLKLLTTIADNTTTTFTDTIADASLGANVPTANTAMANQVQVAGIPFGPGAVTSRVLYRTAVGSPQLKKLTQINDNNSVSSYLDAISDAALGANVPVLDSSGLQQPTSNTVPPGSTTLLVANIGAFLDGGGWAVIGNGAQLIRYHGKAGGSLTGIPVSGPGAIIAGITWNSTITAAPALIGIPASGPGAIVYPVVQGDEVDLFVQVDDTAAQARLAALLGGDGVQEDELQDRRLSHREAVARGRAWLATKTQLVIELRYQVGDLNTRTGRLLPVNLGPPFNVEGNFLIQSVTEHPYTPYAMPLFTAVASNARFTFDEFLRLIHDEVT